jgi:hypothetical protein
VCTKSLSGSAFSPDLLDMGTILFSIDVQKDFAMIADEDAKDKLSAINEGKNTHDSLGRESESL